MDKFKLILCLLVHSTVCQTASYDVFDSILDFILVERVPGTETHLLVRNKIQEFLINLGWDITLDSFHDITPIGKINFTNMIATFNPHAPKRYTLACHYDSKYFPFSEGKPFVGATDAAVPCAMMLYLASILSNEMKQKKSDKTFQLIFFDGEEAFEEWSNEDSLYGSRHLVNFMKETTLEHSGYSDKTLLNSMEIFILLDLIGHCDSSFYNYDLAPSKEDFFQLRKIELELCREKSNSFFVKCENNFFINSHLNINQMITDDHTPFLNTNTKIIHMISYPFPRFWHTVDDDKNVLCEETIMDLLEILKRYLKIKLQL